jgi:hypothetical protein
VQDLFTAAPRGKIFTNGPESSWFYLKNGQAVIFRKQVLIIPGHFIPDKEQISKIAGDFADSR